MNYDGQMRSLIQVLTEPRPLLVNVIVIGVHCDKFDSLSEIESLIQFETLNLKTGLANHFVMKVSVHEVRLSHSLDQHCRQCDTSKGLDRNVCSHH